MKADITAIMPAITHAKIAKLVEDLDIPDVTALNLDDASSEDLATVVYYLEQQLVRAREMFNDACSAAIEAAAKARGRISKTIVDNGGKALPHETFDVHLERRTEPLKRIDVLRRLENVLPGDLYRESVFIKSVEVTHADPRAVEAVVGAGGKPTWDANLTRLNKYARDYGPDSEIAKIIAEGSPRVEVGAPRLVIEPRKSALKAVN